MGQVQVISVRTETVNHVFAALDQAGFEVAPLAASPPSCAQAVWCCRGGRALELHVYPGSDPAESLLVNGHPPYSIWPWRWVGDLRMFNDVTLVLDKFAIRK